MLLRIFQTLTATFIAASTLTVTPHAAAFSSGFGATQVLEEVTANLPGNLPAHAPAPNLGIAPIPGIAPNPSAAEPADQSGQDAAAQPAPRPNVPTVAINARELVATAQTGLYVDNHDWHFLNTTPSIMPGAKITTGVTACSTGYIVEKDRKNYILTAGHCGKAGTEIGVREGDNVRKFGRIEASENNTDYGTDWALVSIEDNTVAKQNHLPLDLPTGSVYTTRQAAQADAICVLGQVSGFSCGSYESMTPSGRLSFVGRSTHGDSGGPIFALKDGVLHPTAILEGGYEGTNLLSGIPLERAIPALGITAVKA